MVKYFGVDLSCLKELGSASIFQKVDGIPFAVFIARERGGMPLPIGCSAISVPIDVRCADGYWFAGLFRLPNPIVLPERQTLVECIASFWPYLVG